MDPIEDIVAEIQKYDRKPTDFRGFREAVWDELFSKGEDLDEWDDEEMPLDEWSGEGDGVSVVYHNTGGDIPAVAFWWAEYPADDGKPAEDRFGYGDWRAVLAELRSLHCKQHKRQECPHCQALIHKQCEECPSCGRYLDTGEEVVPVEAIPCREYLCLEDGGSNRYRWAYRRLMPTDHPGVLFIELDVLPSEENGRGSHDAPELWCCSVRFAMPGGVGRKSLAGMIESLDCAELWHQKSDRYAASKHKDKWLVTEGGVACDVASLFGITLSDNEYNTVRSVVSRLNMVETEAHRGALCLDHGLAATFWEQTGRSPSRLLRKAMEELVKASLLTGSYLDKPVNAIGATGWDAVKGYDVLTVVNRARREGRHV